MCLRYLAHIIFSFTFRDLSSPTKVPGGREFWTIHRLLPRWNKTSVNLLNFTAIENLYIRPNVFGIHNRARASLTHLVFYLEVDALQQILHGGGFGRSAFPPPPHGPLGFLLLFTQHVHVDELEGAHFVVEQPHPCSHRWLTDDVNHVSTLEDHKEKEFRGNEKLTLALSRHFLTLLLGKMNSYFKNAPLWKNWKSWYAWSVIQRANRYLVDETRVKRPWLQNLHSLCIIISVPLSVSYL